MDTSLLNDPTSSEHVQKGPGNRNYSILPPLSRAPPLTNEIPGRLLQNDATTPYSFYGELDMPARHCSPQESNGFSQEEPILQREPAQQEQATLPRYEGIDEQSEHVSECPTVLLQEWSHAEAVHDTQKPMPKPPSWKEKLGIFAMICLIVGSVLLCAAIAILAFLWFGNSAFTAWKEIIARNWLFRAIFICIEVVQQVMMFQLGIVAATIASLALESGDVVVGDLASISTLRATTASTGAFVMAWQYLSHGSFRSAQHYKSFFLILSAALLWCLSQSFLLILLTDVSLRSTAGLVSTVELPYSLHYNESYADDFYSFSSRFIFPSTGAWNRKISNYASFAEYSEPPYEADGVSDTGVTLRAFLPFGTAQSRENLESYKGSSMVLDARVTCQVPHIQNATVDSTYRFRGSIAATRRTPRLSNVALDNGSNPESFEAIGVHPDGSRDFNCVVSRSRYQYGVLRDPNEDQWAISLCQLWQGMEALGTIHFGGLVSEFRDQSQVDEYFNGAAYLYLNYTYGTDLTGLSDQPGRVMAAEASQERDEWLDLTFSNGSIILSASICYAALDFAEIDVRISSQSNRTESRLEPVFDEDTFTYTFKELRYAMGQDRSLPIDNRGMLRLEEQPWQGLSQGRYSAPFHAGFLLRLTADLIYTKAQSMPTAESYGWQPTMTGVLSPTGSCTIERADCDQNCSDAIPDCVTPDLMHIWLVQEILKTNGSIAFAL
ncbi:hypothetical protein Daus18300_010087 [Diaporthe australafricana]|uniref:Uncharacterized protein n=1 Tax=Diaporthe australafricana TaxID=127596 RepID=A0ABR3WBE9_9PEZI